VLDGFLWRFMHLRFLEQMAFVATTTAKSCSMRTLVKMDNPTTFALKMTTEFAHAYGSLPEISLIIIVLQTSRNRRHPV